MYIYFFSNFSKIESYYIRFYHYFAVPFYVNFPFIYTLTCLYVNIGFLVARDVVG